MTDTGTPNGQESQGNGGAQGQESGAGQQGQGQESAQQQQGQEQFSLDSITDPAVRAYVETVQRQAAEARADAGRYRTERNTFQQQVTEAQRANETAEQTAQREAQERQAEFDRLRDENRTLRLTGSVTTAVTTAKAHNPATVTAMLLPKVETDDNGQPTNLDTLVADLKRTDPYLFKRSTQDANEGREDEATPAGGMNSWIRGQAKRG